MNQKHSNKKKKFTWNKIIKIFQNYPFAR
jgi:hypothetical protein